MQSTKKYIEENSHRFASDSEPLFNYYLTKNMHTFKELMAMSFQAGANFALKVEDKAAEKEDNTGNS